jgi:hypothetical protein
VGSSTIRRNEYDVDEDVGGGDDIAQGATSMMASELRRVMTANTMATRMMAPQRMTSRMASRLIYDQQNGD